MSKRFVELDEFKRELKDLRTAISDLNADMDGMNTHLDTIVDVVNANADNGENVEKRLNELQETVKRLERRSQTLSVAVDQKNDPTGPALVVGFFGLVAVIFIAAELSRLNSEINALKKKRKEKNQPVKNDDPVEVSFRDDGTYTSGNKEG